MWQRKRWDFLHICGRYLYEHAHFIHYESYLRKMSLLHSLFDYIYRNAVGVEVSCIVSLLNKDRYFRACWRRTFAPFLFCSELRVN